MSYSRPHVVIIGAGFGGIKAAKMLAKEDVRVTIIDRQNFHLFPPLLYQVSTSVLSNEEIAYPIRSFFRKNKNVELFMARAEGFDTERKVVLTSHGEMPYDYLIVASGSTTNYFGMENVEKYSYGMKTIQEAVHIRNHVLHMFERANKMHHDEAERRKMLTFVCVGGGPTGVEESGALCELVAIQQKEYHNLDFNEVRIILVEATDMLLPMMPPELRDYTVRALEKKGVEVMLNTQVSDCSADGITFKDGTHIPTKTVIWAAGVRAHKIVSLLGKECDRGGRVIVEKTMQVPDLPGVFAVGDCACFIPEEGARPLPTIAPVANQGAEVAAKNVMHLIRKQEMETLTYKDHGAMATIGKGEAVVSTGPLRTGFLAWFIWMGVHLLLLNGAFTNFTVGLKWGWNFLMGIRLGRIITNIDLSEEDRKYEADPEKMEKRKQEASIKHGSNRTGIKFN